MICNLCGAQEATIHLTEIINSQMIEIHLCESCAQEKGTDFKTHFNLSDLLAGLAEGTKSAKGTEKRPALRCLECGITYEEFGKSGRLGCPACYEAFSKMLIPLIKRVQRSINHVGKRPLRVSPQTSRTHELILLQDRLAKSVQMEEFEQAARIRDEIRQLEEKVKKQGKSKS